MTQLLTHWGRDKWPPFSRRLFKCIFLNENVWISLKISLKFVLKGPINNNPALVQIMAWRRPGDKPLSEPRMESLLTHIWVTRLQWVNTWEPEQTRGHSAENIFVTNFRIFVSHFHWSFFLRILWTKRQHWIRQWLETWTKTTYLSVTYMRSFLEHNKIVDSVFL